MIKKAWESFRENKSYYIGIFVVCAAVFAFFYTLNRLTGMHDDDYHFKFVFFDFNPTAYDRRVENLSDIFLSVKNYYILSGGRVVAHFLTYLMLFIGKPFFNVINSLVFVLLGLLVLFIIRGKLGRRNFSSAALLIIIYALFWFLFPAMGETVFWLSGATNYLWMACLCLSFMLPYVRYYRGESRLRDNAAAVVLMFVFGIFAGVTNENTGGAVLYILFIYFLMCRKDKLRIPKWAVSGIVGLVLGITFLVAAPGNAHRAANIEQGSAINFFNSIYKLYYVVSVLRDGTIYLVLAVLLLTVVIIFKSRASEAAKAVTNRSLAFLIGGLMSSFVLLLTPEYNDRAYLFGILLVIVSFLIAADQLVAASIGSSVRKKSLPPKIVLYISTAAVFVFCSLSMRSVFLEFVVMDKFNRYEYTCFEKAKTDGKTEVTIDRIMYRESDYNINDFVKNIGPSDDDYINLWLARYYGFDKVHCGKEINSLEELGLN